MEGVSAKVPGLFVVNNHESSRLEVRNTSNSTTWRSFFFYFGVVWMFGVRMSVELQQ